MSLDTVRSPGLDPLPRRAAEPPRPTSPPHPESLLHRENVAGATAVRPGGVPGLRPQRREHLIDAFTALVVAVITGIGAHTAPIRFDDEGTYVSQALSVLQGSLAPYTYWYDHPPFGWLLLAGWFGVPAQLSSAPNPIAAGRDAMVLVTFVTCYFLMRLIRRLGGSRAAAVGGALLFGLCPLALEVHRMVLLDNIAICFLMMAWTFAATRSRGLTPAVLAGLTLASAVLAKETLLLLAPFVVWLLWRTARGPTRAMCLALFSVAFTLLLAFYPLFALLRGELLAGPEHVSLQQGVLFQLVEREGSGSIFDPLSDAYAVLHGWLAADSWLLLAGLCGALLLVALPRTRPFAAAAVFSGLVILRPGYLPVPYVAVLLPLAAACTALAVDRLLRWSWGELRGRGGVRLRAVAAVVLAGTLALSGTAVAYAAPQWWNKDRVYLTADLDAPTRLATEWIGHNVAGDQVIVTDNVFWTDLVNGAGREQANTVWFTKLDVDPDVDSRITDWRAIDYVIESDIIRTGQRPPVLQEALENSRIVAAFGTGPHRILIRRVAE